MADNCILEPWTSVLSGMGGGGHWDMNSRESEVMTRDSPTAAKRPRHAASGAVTTGRVSKRRPKRASKKSPTTFIAADPANFRQMVQEVTGVQIPVMTSGGVFPLSRPEQQRAGSSWQNGGLGGRLPTLDSSAFVLDGSAFFDRSAGMASAPAFSSGGLDMGLPCFPTLESSREVR